MSFNKSFSRLLRFAVVRNFPDAKVNTGLFL
jgi:hypothetical protein